MLCNKKGWERTEMPKCLQITHTHNLLPSDLRKLEKKEKIASNQRRIIAVRMIMEGYMAIEVAKLLGIHRQSVSSYIIKFEKGGIEELLARKPIPGKQPRLRATQQQELKQLILHSTPTELDISQDSFWNTRTIQQLIQQKFDVDLSRESIRTMLHRLRLSYTRATYVLKKADKLQQQQFQNQIQVIKKT
jgi:transposase